MQGILQRCDESMSGQLSVMDHQSVLGLQTRSLEQVGEENCVRNRLEKSPNYTTAAAPKIVQVMNK